MDQEQLQNSVDVKIVLLGESGVGKSSIITRLLTDNFFETASTTLGAAFAYKMMNIEGSNIKFQIWDTAGQERYRALLPLYYRDTQVAIIVYDVSSADGLEQLKYWIEQLRDNGPKGLIIYMVGNKTDLLIHEVAPQDQAVVEYSKELGMELYQTSCKTGEGIQDLFLSIGRRVFQSSEILKKSRRSEGRSDRLNTPNSEGQRKFRCC